MNINCPGCNTVFPLNYKKANIGDVFRVKCPECQEKWRFEIEFYRESATKGAPWRLEFLKRVRAAYARGGPGACQWERLHGLPAHPPWDYDTSNRPRNRENSAWSWRRMYLNSARELVRRGVLVDCNKTGKNGNSYGFLPADAKEVGYWTLTEGNGWRITQPDKEDLLYMTNRGKVINITRRELNDKKATFFCMECPWEGLGTERAAGYSKEHPKGICPDCGSVKMTRDSKMSEAFKSLLMAKIEIDNPV